MPVGSTGSFFLEEAGAGGSQTVYRRASVYFSIVKSSRKFPGYFNPVEKRVIVNWTKNIASSGPDPPDAHMVVTARTGSGRDHHKVTRVWNYHQVKAWYQTLYQRLCATKKANAKTKVPAAHQNYMRSIPMNFSTQQNALMQAAMQQPVVDGRGKKRPYPGYPAQNNVQQMMSMQGMMPGMVMPNMPNMQNQMGQMMSNMGQFNFPQNVQQMMQLQAQSQMMQQQMLAQQQHHVLLAQQHQQQSRAALLQSQQQAEKIVKQAQALASSTNPNHLAMDGSGSTSSTKPKSTIDSISSSTSSTSSSSSSPPMSASVEALQAVTNASIAQISAQASAVPTQESHSSEPATKKLKT